MPGEIRCTRATAVATDVRRSRISSPARAALVALCIAVSWASWLAPSAAHAQEPRAAYGAWSTSDEAWYERNRRFALAGKILTIAGVAALVAGVSSTEAAVWGPGGFLQAAGQFTWAGSDLRAANELRRRGHPVRKAAGVFAVIGAVVFSPMTWIAGPIQSAHIRNAHDRIAGPSDVPLARSFGLKMRLRF